MLVPDVLRNIGRRPLRSTLTAAGIAIGVTVLVVLGGLSERLSRLVEGGRDFATGQITVGGAGANAVTGMTRGGLLSSDQLATLSAVPGVAKVAPIVMFPVSDGTAALPFTLPPLVFGVDLEALLHNRRTRPPRVRDGRLMPRSDSNEVVLGSQVARSLNATTGGTVTLRGGTFQVAGVLEPTLTGPDSFIFMPFPTAQRLLLDSEPLLRRLASVPGAKVLPIATAAAVFWADGTDPEVVASRIRERLAQVAVASPADAARQIDRALTFITSIIVGSGLVALLVGSLAVANTMLTAVIERRREIGLRRVVGMTRRQVVAYVLTESAALCIAGSALGIVGGAAAISGLNALTERLGGAIFLLTPRLIGAAIALPAALAILAGLWPAWRAARVAPTAAVRQT